MSEPFKGTVNIDIKDSVPDWAPYTQPTAPESAPNVLYVVLDDVGFSAMEPYGGFIETPNIKRIADQGLTYTNFHTTALCSPTRSCLLTGRNHTTNGMACITEAASGFPNANGHVPFECASIAEVLNDQGWNTYAVGKWHLTAEDEMNLASSKRQWPLGRGFERFYGFLGGETNQWYPDLVYDNHPVPQPSTPEEGYHLTVDLTDKAIEFVQDAKAIAPDKPFFLLLSWRSPRPAPIRRESGRQVQGQVRHGLRGLPRAGLRESEAARDRLRGRRALTDQPVCRDDEPRRKALVEARPGAAVGFALEDEKRLFARMAEVYAGFLSHADHELGRLLDFLEESGQLDNTIVVLVSDNGASGEGGPNGTVNENNIFNGVPDTIEENLKLLDELGSPKTNNHYPTGWAWAFNTPFKMWKRYASYEGGIADPLIVSWPAASKRSRATRPVHACDRHRSDPPRVPRRRAARCRQRLRAEPARGTQLHVQPRRRERGDTEGNPVLLDARHPRNLAQGLEGRYRGSRGARVMGRLRPATLGALRHRKDPSECHDLAEAHPEKLQELIALWDSEAAKYGAFPLESRTAIEILGAERPQLSQPRTGTSTTRAELPCPSPLLRTFATGRSRSPPRSRSRHQRPPA